MRRNQFVHGHKGIGSLTPKARVARKILSKMQTGQPLTNKERNFLAKFGGAR